MGALQRIQNHHKHRLGVQQYIVVPKTQHSIAALREFTITPRVICLLSKMLPAINLDHQPGVDARKISDVISYRYLPPEAKPRQLSIAQMPPQMLLGRGC